MKSFKQYISEKLNVHGLSIDIRKAIDTAIFTYVKNKSEFFIDTATGGGTDYDSSEVLEQVLEYWYDSLKDISYFKQAIPLENLFEQIATEYAVNKFGTIPKILVSFAHEDMHGNGTRGYFTKTPYEYAPRTTYDFKKQFTALKYWNEGKNEVVGIAVICNFKNFMKYLREDITEYIGNTSELNSYTEYHNDVLVDMIENIIDTYAHEVEHAFQYIEQFNKKIDLTDYVIKSKSIISSNIIKNAVTNDVGAWTDSYMSNLIEIDAHATSVASTIIQQMFRHQRISNENKISNINNCLNELSYLYNNNKSFEMYKQNIHSKITEHPSYLKVWKRFIKKIYTKVDAYRDVIKADLAEEQRLEKEQYKRWDDEMAGTL